VRLRPLSQRRQRLTLSNLPAFQYAVDEGKFNPNKNHGAIPGFYLKQGLWDILS
jgi:hypothetical protein